MNVYGYPSYSYNQSEDLAKPAFVQPVSYSNRGVSEGHVMPVPTGTPWNVQGVAWGMQSSPGLVQFTAAGRCLLNEREELFSPVIHCKRKSLDVEPVIPSKQRITEEKMAAHLNGLHISSDYTSHSSETMDINMEPFISTEEKLKGHKIVLSEELKKLQDEPLLPASLIESLEKPHMSLVVWKPREHILGLPNKQKNAKEEEPRRRNGVLAVNHPTMDDVDM